MTVLVIQSLIHFVYLPYIYASLDKLDCYFLVALIILTLSGVWFDSWDVSANCPSHQAQNECMSKPACKWKPEPEQCIYKHTENAQFIMVLVSVLGVVISATLATFVDFLREARRKWKRNQANRMLSELIDRFSSSSSPVWIRKFGPKGRIKQTNLAHSLNPEKLSVFLLAEITKTAANLPGLVDIVELNDAMGTVLEDMSDTSILSHSPKAEFFRDLAEHHQELFDILVNEKDPHTDEVSNTNLVQLCSLRSISSRFALSRRQCLLMAGCAFSEGPTPPPYKQSDKFGTAQTFRHGRPRQCLQFCCRIHEIPKASAWQAPHDPCKCEAGLC